MTGDQALEAALKQHLSGGGYVLGEQVEPGPQAIQTSLSEGATVGLALGLAASGASVVVRLVDASGLGRAQQVLTEAVALGARAEGFGLRLVVVAPENLPAWSLPKGIQVFSGVSGVGTALAAALAVGKPAVVLVPALYEDESKLDSGIFQSGAVCTLACWGDAARTVAEGISQLPEGTEVVVLDQVFPPLPALVESVRKTGRLVMAGPVFCGPLLTEITVLDNQSFWRLDAPPRFVGASLDHVVQGVRDSISC